MAPHRRASVVDNVNSEQWLVDIMDRFPDLASAMHTLQSLRKVSLMERRRHSIAFSALGGSGSGWAFFFDFFWCGGEGRVWGSHPSTRAITRRTRHSCDNVVFFFPLW